MTGEEIIQLAMARRTQAGLHLRIFGEKAAADSVCEHSYPADHATMDRWIKAAIKRGYQYEVVGA